MNDGAGPADRRGGAPPDGQRVRANRLAAAAIATAMVGFALLAAPGWRPVPKVVVGGIAGPAGLESAVAAAADRARRSAAAAVILGVRFDREREAAAGTPSDPAAPEDGGERRTAPSREPRQAANQRAGQQRESRGSPAPDAMAAAARRIAGTAVPVVVFVETVDVGAAGPAGRFTSAIRRFEASPAAERVVGPGTSDAAPADLLQFVGELRRGGLAGLVAQPALGDRIRGLDLDQASLVDLEGRVIRPGRRSNSAAGAGYLLLVGGAFLGGLAAARTGMRGQRDRASGGGHAPESTAHGAPRAPSRGRRGVAVPPVVRAGPRTVVPEAGPDRDTAGRASRETAGTDPGAGGTHPLARHLTVPRPATVRSELAPSGFVLIGGGLFRATWSAGADPPPGIGETVLVAYDDLTAGLVARRAMGGALGRGDRVEGRLPE